MYQELFGAVEQGATVLTGSNRLAHALAEAYTGYERDRGRSVWSTPAILSWNAYLEQCWRNHLLDHDGPLLLNPAQEAAVWEGVIRDSPEGRTLLRVPETAQRVMEAWQLVQAYRLPFNEGQFAASEDCEAFSRWAGEFQVRRDTNRWLEAARLSDAVAGLIRNGSLARPSPLLLAGFDELTPQQQDLRDALCAGQDWKAPVLPGSVNARCLRDTNDEILQAALWARDLLASNPAASIGVAVPNIEVLRPKLERIFTEVLHPGAGFEAMDRAFHISLGPALSQQPVVHAALLALEFIAEPMEQDRLGMLLRSPFLKGSEDEQSSRAGLDALLRRKAPPEAGIEQVRAFADACPVLNRALGTVEKEVRKLPAEQYPSLWTRSFSRLLKSAGWPGDRALSSHEYQVVEAWNGLLTTLSTLDAMTGRVSFNSALLRLRKLAEATKFQAENEGAAVQVLGLLEASGLQFDHLWVMGLHDEALPGPARPHPFLPVSLQRQYQLPHASAEREWEFAGKLMARIQGSARNIVLSYPEWEGDQQLGPSPLLPQAGALPSLDRKGAVWQDVIRASAASETLEDAVAPELPIGTEQHGGTWVLRDMAACPFRAFAQYRLGARPLEDAVLGIDPRDRGTAVHKAMELIWIELKTHRELCARTPQHIDQVVAACVATALGDSPGLGRSLERRRLERLLTDWLEIEKARPPFTVLEREEKHSVDLGGLRITTRIDRVDALEDGRQVIIDYKTGEVKTTVWTGERPDEPQVPLYCASTGNDVAAAAFARLRRSDLGFLGLADGGELGKIKSMRTEKGVRLPDLILQWEQTLQNLALDFRTGVARVDPKAHSSCTYCDITALCRVRDSQELDADEE
jgi:ATP-dependent helicase/nuclease subunit B